MSGYLRLYETIQHDGPDSAMTLPSGRDRAEGYFVINKMGKPLTVYGDGGGMVIILPGASCTFTLKKAEE
jgi:hypothetical protein